MLARLISFMATAIIDAFRKSRPTSGSEGEIQFTLDNTNCLRDLHWGVVDRYLKGDAAVSVTSLLRNEKHVLLPTEN